ncbi:MAG TPA: biotin/lipoyl-containing protein [Bryobacteraceae bacterium]|nr:biotin/lipoyl-containing protein [Bryobacteraceae bacterium]
MKAKVSVDGRPFEIDLERDGADWKASGRPVSVVEVEPGIYSVLLGGRSYEARIEKTLGGIAVNVGPRRYSVDVADPRQFTRTSGAAGRQGRQRVIAPMPGKIVRVLVMAGDSIEVGQGIAVIEAMKMQNEMKAPKSGRIVALQAKEGQPVSTGDVIAEIE